MELLDEGLAGGRVDLLDVVGGDVHVLQARRREALVLVALADIDRGGHRQPEVRRGRLLVVGRLRRADEERHHEVGLGCLDVLDRLAELRDAERDELLAHHRATVVLDDVAHPLSRDLAEVVVGSDGVDVLAVLLHHPRDERRELLLGHRTGDDHVGVADAALVLVVVEGEAVELVHDRPVGLARGRGEAGEDHVHLVRLQHAGA